MFGRRKLKRNTELDDYTVEPMEPRVLLSADALGVDAGVLDPDAVGQADWDLQDADDWSRSLASHDIADTAPLDPAGGDADARVEIVFLDAGVEDGQQLLADLFSQNGSAITQVHLLDSNSDGIDQIAEVLAGQQGIDAIHIISHGAAGQIQLGGGTLSTGSLDGYAGQLNDWGSALADSGDILIYGCDLAADAQGRALVNAIGILTGADVAASVDPTGHVTHGGDWELEYRAGTVEATAFAPTALQTWQGTLAAPIANPGGPYSIAEGEQLDLDGSASSDPDGTVTSWEWDIGDNGTFEKSGEAVSYTWTELVGAGVIDDGTVDVTLRITDDGGAQTIQPFQITVDNAAPTLMAGGTGSATAGTSYTLDLTASDPGDDTITSYTVNWGDGTITTEAFTGVTTSVTHTYNDAGFTRNITFAAVDEDGTWTSSDLVVGTFVAGTDEIYRFDGDFDGADGVFDSSGGDLNRPYAPVVGPDGNYYVSGFDSDNIVRYAPDGSYLGVFSTDPLFGEPNGLAWGPDGALYVANYGHDNILRVDTGGTVTEWGTAGGVLNGPSGLAWGPDGNLYVAGFDNDSLVKFDGATGGTPTVVINTGLDRPEQIAFDAAGDLYIANHGASEVVRWDGASLTPYFTDPNLSFPTGLAFGPDGQLYVSSYGNDKILRYDGVIGEVFADDGPGGLGKPEYLTFSPAHQVMVSAAANDAPTLGNNAISISQGGGIILDSSILSATDVDNADSGLKFTVSGVSNGWFALKTDTSTPITSFDQSDVTARNVVFLHDGGELAPAYQVSVSDGTDSTAPVAASVTFSDTSSGVLWLSTDGDEGASNGVPGLDTNGWNSGDILQQAGPNLSLGEADTDGTFSIAFDVADFAPGANINGMHFVTGNISIGATNAITLQAGDLLLTTENDETFVSNGAETKANLAVMKEDIFYFRPDKAGDYSKGNFYVLLNDPLGGDTTISALTLVEKDVWVGDVQLSAGDLLVAGDEKDIWWLATAAIDPTNAASYSGDAKLLIAGDDPGLDLGAKIAGLDVLESDISGGGQSYDAGTILMTLDGDDSDVGTTGRAFDRQDIVALQVIKTTLGAGAGNARVDATLMFDGDHVSDNDVNFDSGSENLDALTLTVVPGSGNAAPSLGNATLTVSEGETVTLTGAMLSASDLNDADSGLKFSVTSVIGGQFEIAGNSGVAVTSFTLGQVNAGDVRFVDDGDELAPSFYVEVTDGSLTDGPVAATINFTNVNDNAPTLVNPIADQSATEDVAFSFQFANATFNDADAGDTLNYTAKQAGGTPLPGWLNFDAATRTFFGTPLNSDVGVLNIEVTATDGAGATVTDTFDLTISNVNDAPVLGNNRMTLYSGDTVVLTPSMLSATDVDHASGGLQFTVSTVSGGQFELTSASGVAIFSFTQAQVAAGDVVFVDDGDNVAPAYSVTVADTVDSFGPRAASVVFNPPTVVTTIEPAPEPVPVIDPAPVPAPKPISPDPPKPDPDPDPDPEPEPEPEPEPDPEPDEGPGEEPIVGGEDDPLSTATAGGGSSVGPVSIVDFGSGSGSEGGSMDGLLKSLFLRPAALTAMALQQSLPGSFEIDALAREVRDVLASTEFNSSLDRMRDGVSDATIFHQSVVGSSVAVTTGLSVGYVAWLVRGGVLLSTALSSLPAWQFIDPLPVLARTRDDEDGNDDSLQSIIQEESERAANRAKETDEKNGVGGASRPADRA